MPDDLFSLLDQEDIQEKNKSKEKKKKGFSGLGDVLSKYQLTDKGGYVTKEFQDFGLQLAGKLNDLKHKSLYIRMAKTVDRAILERALAFVSDAHSAKSKARLFMWKVKLLKEERKKKEITNEKKS